jgi:hypothetical protein
MAIPSGNCRLRDVVAGLVGWDEGSGGKRKREREEEAGSSGRDQKDEGMGRRAYLFSF